MSSEVSAAIECASKPSSRRANQSMPVSTKKRSPTSASNASHADRASRDQRV
jgi:hypothetical protein